MILSPREAQAVLKVASSYGVDGNPEELIDDALQAICTGGADQAAYVVARAGGVGFIGDFIWWKDRQLVRADQARTLIAQAKQDQTYEGPIPEDDAKAIEEANALIELATDAWNDMVRGSEVETILRMAAQFDNGGDPEPEVVETGQAEAQEKIPPEEQVQEADPPLVENAVAAFRTDDLDELAKVEPWESYAQEKVADIIAGVNAAIETYELEELYDLLRNIWAYESAHRARKTILDALEEVHNQIASKQREQGDTPYAPPNQIPRPSQEPSPAPAGEAQAPAEVDEPEPAAVAEGGAQDGEEVLAADREPDADADADLGAEAAAPLPQEPADEAPPVAQAGPQRPADGDPYQELISEVEGQISRERLHTPEPPTEAAPEIPWDWTQISDKELQQLHSAFSSMGYYVDYKLSRENRIALLCKQAADELSRELLVALTKHDIKGKDVKITLLEAQVEADENVKTWRQRQRRHEAFASGFRSERDSYYKLLEGLSRHESMRMDEWQRAGGKPGSILRRAK